MWRSASQRRVGGRSNDARTYHAPDTASTAIWLHGKRRKAVVSDAYSPSSVVTTVPDSLLNVVGPPAWLGNLSWSWLLMVDGVSLQERGATTSPRGFFAFLTLGALASHLASARTHGHTPRVSSPLQELPE